MKGPFASKTLLITFVVSSLLVGCQSGNPAATTGSSGSASNGGASTSGGGASSSSNDSSTGGAGGTTGAGESACPTGSLCTLSDGGASFCCEGACVDLYTDSQNCSGCGVVCPGHSQCRSAGCYVTDCTGVPPTACNPPSLTEICCNGSCVEDTSALFDDANCGGCGLTCPDGSTCQAAGCGPVGMPAACSAGSCPDGGACVVGYTGPRCAPTSCGADGGACALATGDQGICCGETCVDHRFDSANCDGCGSPCSQGEACVLGRCLATNPCDSSSNGEACQLSNGKGGICCASACVDLEHDPQNCGACGAICPGDGICVQMACLDPATLIPLRCYFESDAGASCPAGTACLGAYQCESLYCRQNAGENCANGTCCASGCTNTQLDPANCGQCGVVCSSGLCVEGTCMPLAGDAGCPQGCPSEGVCINGLCLSPNCDSVLCAFSATQVGLCCDEVGCVDPAHDPQNCGGCDVACPTGQQCANGVCSGTPPACLGGNLGGFCDLDAGFNWICCQGTGCVDTGGNLCPL